MTNHFELDVVQLETISGGAAEHNGVCIDPLVLMWKLQNPGRVLQKWLAGMTDSSSKF
ncbi:hypothetical protein [Synechococcus sp. MIT S1220]|uniref:hypothetical protein n=1 Tax=Synechococcus sp. MIT S1220 TaxID=3082549 RepID=UPI0039AF5AE3